MVFMGPFALLDQLSGASQRCLGKPRRTGNIELTLKGEGSIKLFLIFSFFFLPVFLWVIKVRTV